MIFSMTFDLINLKVVKCFILFSSSLWSMKYFWPCDEKTRFGWYSRIEIVSNLTNYKFRLDTKRL